MHYLFIFQRKGKTKTLSRAWCCCAVVAVNGFCVLFKNNSFPFSVFPFFLCLVSDIKRNIKTPCPACCTRPSSPPDPLAVAGMLGLKPTTTTPTSANDSNYSKEEMQEVEEEEYQKLEEEGEEEEEEEEDDEEEEGK